MNFRKVGSVLVSVLQLLSVVIPPVLKVVGPKKPTVTKS